jgi:hypothetical protein
VHEPVLGRQFLNESGDGRPEHPETGGDQRIHQVELPDLHAMPEREDGHRHNDHGAHGVEPHHQPPAVFAVNDNAGEGQHEHGGNGLQNNQRAQGLFGVRGLQDVPGDGGRVHPAAQHGNQVGRKDEAQRTLAEDATHLSTLAEGGKRHQPRGPRRFTKEMPHVLEVLRKPSCPSWLMPLALACGRVRR